MQAPASDPGPTERTRWTAVRESPLLLADAARAAFRDSAPVYASAVAYSLFLSIPATLLLVVGAFSLVADPTLVSDLMERFEAVAPDEAVVLLQDSLLQLEQRPSAGLTMALVGLGLAIWTTTGAMTTLMQAVNRAHDLEDSRSFAGKRLVALALFAALGFATLLIAVLLVLGSHLQRWIGSTLDAESAVSLAWTTARWPILVVVLFVAFSVLYALATDRPSRRWRLLSPGALVAVVLWLAVSYGFGLYVSHFGAYNKTWGSLSAAIVTLVWLWLSALALLLGAEVNAEAERVAREDPRESARDEDRSRRAPLSAGHGRDVE